MLQWEYMTMECAGDGDEPAVRIAWPGQEPFDLAPGTGRLAAMNSMGLLGWELVASEVVRTDIEYADLSVAHGTTHRTRYLFKRPRGTDDPLLMAEALEAVGAPAATDPV